MTKEEYLLTCLAEECAEVQQRICKALRFGLEEKQANGPSTNVSDDTQLTNRERILAETLDLNSVYRMLIENKILRSVEEDEYELKHSAKQEKVFKYLNYAQSIGQVKG